MSEHVVKPSMASAADLWETRAAVERRECDTLVEGLGQVDRGDLHRAELDGILDRDPADVGDGALATLHAEALELLGEVNWLVVDKTGTLTQGKPAVTRIVVAPRFVEETILRLAAGVEKASEHPLITAVIDTPFTAIWRFSVA